MQIALRNFEYTDVPQLDDWCHNINAYQYMSHFHPEVINTGTSGNCVWYIIQVDGRDIGTIWLEKLPDKSRSVKLGILIGFEEYFGKEIGRHAVELAIEKAESSLSFERIFLHVRCNNIRAIRCYSKCGFKIVGEFSKTNDKGQVIHAYRMERKLKNN